MKRPSSQWNPRRTNANLPLRGNAAHFQYRFTPWPTRPLNEPVADGLGPEGMARPKLRLQRPAQPDKVLFRKHCVHRELKAARVCVECAVWHAQCKRDAGGKGTGG
jgi:hypothetical protein